MLNQSVMSSTDCEQLCSILELEESQTGNQSRERFIAARIAALKDQKRSELSYLAQQMAEEEEADQQQKQQYDNSNLFEESSLSDLNWKQNDDIPQQFSKESDDEEDNVDIINQNQYNQYPIQDKLQLFQQKFQNNFKNNKISQDQQSFSQSSQQSSMKLQNQQHSQQSQRSHITQQNLQSQEMQNFSTFNQRCQEQQDYLEQPNPSVLEEPQSIDFDNLFQPSENHQHFNNTFNTNNTSTTQLTTTVVGDDRNLNYFNVNYIDTDRKIQNSKYPQQVHNRLNGGATQKQDQFAQEYQQFLEKSNIEDRLIAEMLSNGSETNNNTRNNIPCSKQEVQMDYSKQYQPTKFTQFFLKEVQQPQSGLVDSTTLIQTQNKKNVSPGSSQQQQSYVISQLRIGQNNQGFDEMQNNFMDQNQNEQRLRLSNQAKSSNNCQNQTSNKIDNITTQKSKNVIREKENIQFMMVSQNEQVNQQQQLSYLPYNNLDQEDQEKLILMNSRNQNNFQEVINPSNLNISAKSYPQELSKPPLRFNIKIAQYNQTQLVNSSQQHANQKPTTIISNNCNEKEEQKIGNPCPPDQVRGSRSNFNIKMKNQQEEQQKERVVQVNQEEQNVLRKINVPSDNRINQQRYSQLEKGKNDKKQEQFMSVYERNQQFLREKELRQIFLREKYTSEELHHTFTPNIQPQSRDLIRNLKDLKDWKENLSQRNEKLRQKQVEEEIEAMEVLQNEKLMCKGSERILQNSSRFLNKQKIEDKLIQSGMKYSARRQELDKQYNSNPAKNSFKLLVGMQNAANNKGSMLNNNKNKVSQSQLSAQQQNSTCVVSNTSRNQEIFESKFSPLRRDIPEDQREQSQGFFQGQNKNMQGSSIASLKTITNDFVSISQQQSRLMSNSRTPEREINNMNLQTVKNQQLFKQSNNGTLTKTQDYQRYDTQQKVLVSQHQHGYKQRDKSEITGRHQEKMITEPNKDNRSQSSCQNSDQNNRNNSSNQIMNLLNRNIFEGLRQQYSNRGEYVITQNMKTEGNKQDSQMRHSSVEQQWGNLHSQLMSTSRFISRK